MSPDASDPDAARWARVSAAFDAAADLAPSERTAALDHLCRDADGRPDAALRAEVESLLSADADATTGDDALDGGLDASALLDTAPVVGERIGPWRVLRSIGRGGMGRVDLVERADGAYDQKAALKRLGLVAPARVRRFLRERQILATLDHPGIARLLDGGVADDGAPYLVMEYVEGEPITAYADRHGLGLRARLRLFLQVCDAVAFAHRHLVVHRDLKPSNVLVGEGGTGEAGGTGTAEAEGVPAGARATLLDFGIARLLDAETDEPLTDDGPGAPLTPGYAAPEQVAGEPVTTATDVWALGVLLYELIAGRRPIEADTRRAWADAVLRTSPTAPSQAADGTTAARHLRGDLDAIALTALRREPEARYASASDLAHDLRRYLAGEPVQARAPSVGYRARRFVGRHRAAVAAAALVAVAVVAGGAATAWQAREAHASAAESAATADFLAGLFQGADPTASGDSLLALDLLRRGAGRIDAELSAQPGARARLGLVVGHAYLGLGRPDSAAAFARRTLALRQPGGAVTDAAEAVRARILLGRALFPTDPTAAAATLSDAVGDARAVGDDAVLLDALEAQGSLVGGEVLGPVETAAVLEEAVALCRRVEGDASPRLGRLLATLATRASSAHMHGRVEGLWRDALALLPAETAPYDRSTALIELGRLLEATGQADEAGRRVEEALALRRRLLGPDDARTAEALAVRAGMGHLGPTRSEADAREALRIAERAGDGSIVLDALDALGAALTTQGRLDEAVDVYRQRFERAGEVYGTGGTRYPAASGTVARALHRAGRYLEAGRAWDESLRLTTAAYGPESAVAAAGLLDAAVTAEAAGDARRAERLLEQAFVASRGLQPSSRTRALAALRLGLAHLDAGRAQEAIAPLRAAVAARETLDRVGGHGGREPADGARAQALLGEALVATGSTEEGQRFLAAAVPALTQALGADHPDVRRARAVMAR